MNSNISMQQFSFSVFFMYSWGRFFLQHWYTFLLKDWSFGKSVGILDTHLMIKNGEPNYGPKIRDIVKRFFACYRECLVRALKVVPNVTGNRKFSSEFLAQFFS